MGHRQITAPRSWMEPESHFKIAMESEWYHGLVAIQDALTFATMQFWSEKSVRFGHLAITSGSVSSPMGLGSDSMPVQVQLHGVPTFLADSMQFSLEYLCRMSERGAYYMMPSFRGEAADATHLTQFFHSEAEVPGGLRDVLSLVEDFVRYLAGFLFDHHGKFIERAAGDTSHIEGLLGCSTRFRQVTFEEAMTLLPEPDSVYAAPDGRWRTVTRAGERRLMDRVGEFVWITHWDHLAVPFYQAFDESKKRALNGDLLFGPGEVVGAGERHTTGQQVRMALDLHGVPPEGYEWYAEMKDCAPMRTAGFGVGVERFLMWVLRHDDIRDLQLLPRENGRVIYP